MKNLLIVLVSLFSVNALAEVADINFTFTSPRSAYSCDYAKTQFKNYVAGLGGEIERLNCSGGLPHSTFVSLRSKVVTPNPDEENTSWATVEFKGNKSCEFNSRMIQKIISNFRTRNLQARDNCWYSEGRYSYTLEVAN